MPNFLQSPIGEDPVVSRIALKATPDRVFDAWTNPREVKMWFGSSPDSLQRAEIDLRIGGKWRFTFVENPEVSDFVSGEYLEIVKFSRLVFTWRHQRKERGNVVEESPISKVVVTIEGSHDGSVLTVTHSATESQASRQNVAVGWSVALESLRKLVAIEAVKPVG